MDHMLTTTGWHIIPLVKKTLLVSSAALLGCLISSGPVQGQTPAAKPAVAAPTAASERALLDQYCVTCHNDKAKIANLSLQKLDLNTVGDNPELWERVIR